MISNRPLRKRRGEIIQNGGKCNPGNIDGSQMYVKNTCAFDAIAEVSSSPYSNFYSFKKEVDMKLNHLFFSFTSTYAKGVVSAAFYCDKTEI